MNENKPDNRVVVLLPHVLTSDHVKALEAVFNEHIESGKKHIIADASNLAYIDSIGIGFLAKVLQKIKTSEGEFCIRDLADPIMNRFKQAGLHQFFTLQKGETTLQAKRPIMNDHIDPAFDLTYEMMGDVAVFHAWGLMTYPTGVRRFKETALIAMASSEKFLLDLEKLIYLDSPAVGEIMIINGLLQVSGGELRICNLNEDMTELFRTLQLEKILHIHSNAKEALDLWNKEPKQG